MRKLRLEIDKLRVESFPITPETGPHGTVHARAVAPEHKDYPPTSFENCNGGGVVTVGTCIGPTYCCGATWKPSCDWSHCGPCTQGGDSCVASCFGLDCSGL